MPYLFPKQQRGNVGQLEVFVDAKRILRALPSGLVANEARDELALSALQVRQALVNDRVGLLAVIAPALTLRVVTATEENKDRLLGGVQRGQMSLELGDAFERRLLGHFTRFIKLKARIF